MLADAFFPYMVSLSVVLQVFAAIRAIADYSQLKKRLMGIFAYVGSIPHHGDVFFGREPLFAGGRLVLSPVRFGASIVFYNAFLPDIAAPDNSDRVSSKARAIDIYGRRHFVGRQFGLCPVSG